MSGALQNTLSQIVALGIGVALAVIGYLFARRQDRLKQREAKRVEEVASAYLALADAVERPWTDQRARAFEAAFDRLQLYGTAIQIEVAQQALDEFVADGAVSLSDLLAILRDSVRRDLGLPPVDLSHRSIRLDVRKERCD